MKHLSYLVLLTLFFFSFFSCKKVEPQFEDENNRVLSKMSTDANSMAISTPTPDLDWENILNMPVPTGQNVIPAPWNSGNSQQISSDILHDYKKIDGWVLVYNTFTTEPSASDNYFMLYNKYRGLLRFYLFVNTSSPVPSSNLVHKIALEGSYASTSNSPFVKFAASSIVGVDENLNLASTIEQWQVGNGTWYALEYELAYDPSLAMQSYLTSQLRWTVTSNNVQQVVVNGKSEGTLRGSISLPGFDLTINPSFNTSNSNMGRGNIIIKGASDVEKVKPSITTQLFDKLKGLVGKKLTSIGGGLVENIFTGIFGGNGSGSEDNVNLRITSDISLQGTITENSLITSRIFSVPGTNQGNTSGYLPAYNSPLGVFWISNKPSITETEHRIFSDGSPGGPITPPVFGSSQYRYQVNNESFNFIFNPSVLEIADIQNISREIILGYSDVENTGRIEEIGDVKYITGNSVGVQGFPVEVIGVRISFDVVPKDGSRKSKIVKTFSSNVERRVVNNPPGEEEW